MIKYGKRKRRGSTIHPTADSDKDISKSGERFKERQIMEQALIETFRNISKETFEKTVQAIFDN